MERVLQSLPRCLPETGTPKGFGNKPATSPLFGTQPVDTFNYRGYADLMVNYSVGGVKPGEVCVIALEHQDVTDPTLKIYQSLLQKGYLIAPVLRPQAIENILRQGPALL